MSRLTAVDAQSFWLSSKIPNDTFLLFGFEGVPADVQGVLDELRVRATTRCDELRVCVGDGSRWGYPAWLSRAVDPGQLVRHDLEESTWSACQTAVTALFHHQLDATAQAWRLHVFPDVHGVPTVSGAATVAVLQISHALGGGGRTALSAALMFGRDGALPAVAPWSTSPFALLPNGIRAARAHRKLLADTESGVVPAPASPRRALRTNARPAGVRGIRVLTRPRAGFSTPTVTVAALSGISVALAEHLRALGDDPSHLGAEVMIAKRTPRRSFNHFGSAGIGLHPDLDDATRAELIVAEIADRRRRAGHPATDAADVAFSSTPGALLRWGTARFDPDIRPSSVIGNTVVSSVDGGPADYAFGDAPIAVLAAFPGLSPMMGLTHCVCGVGDTISVTVHAAESALGEFPDGLDTYVARLERAFG